MTLLNECGIPNQMIITSAYDLDHIRAKNSQFQKLKRAAEDADDIVNLFTINADKSTSRPFPKKFEINPGTQRPASLLVSERTDAETTTSKPAL
jgi:hypothetical protein